MTYDPDAAAAVAYATAALMVNELFAGADPDRKTEVFVRVLPYFESDLLAYCDAVRGQHPKPVPGTN